ncbi:glycosyltransferase family 39 protein [Protaetiibacter larvae]|uniref:glycosyltransferase family 39 protein n=1 Tax=Protaetiibacter larvae TaxID=2592654 RepID=UPI00143D14E6|nr:glycosyltransferase family 39 protein [Protaetiibacter larvae]
MSTGLAARSWAFLTSPRATWWLVGALVAVGSLIRIPQLGHTLAEAYAFRQTQTAFVAREYSEHGIDLFRTPLPVFGPDADVPMEFPLWQGIAALFMMAGQPADVAVRTLALLSFQLCAVLLAVLVRRWHGAAAAVVSVGLLQFLPFGLLWGAASLIDFFSVALSLLMVIGIDAWFERRHLPWLAVGSAAAVLAFLVKVTTVPSWGLLLVVSLVLMLRARGWVGSWRRLLAGLIGPVAGFAAALAWTAYADAVKRAEPLTQFLTSSQLRDWNFGTLSQRVEADGYWTILGRLAGEIAGPMLFGLAIAVAAAIFQSRFEDRLRSLGWLLVAVSAPLVFFNLYVVHSYYLIAIYPAIVAAMAVGGVWLLRTLRVQRWQRVALAALATGVLFAGTVLSPQGHANVAQWARGNAEPALSRLLAERTPEGSPVIIVGCDWDPSFLYYAQRAGMMFRGSDAGDTWSRHDIGAYAALYNCRPDLDPADYLPAGVVAVGTDDPGLYRLEQR